MTYTVLIVDDSKLARMSVAKVLSTLHPDWKRIEAANAAEGCGPGFWRGPGGHCHPFAVNRACPVGYHLGPEGKRCWPN